MEDTIDSLTIAAKLNAEQIQKASLSLVEHEGLDQNWIDNLEALVRKAGRINLKLNDLVAKEDRRKVCPRLEMTAEQDAFNLFHDLYDPGDVE